MTKFRIQNYKKINDTGWINCDKLTTFVGVNEAGKSAICRGLAKFNPSDKQEYDGLKEFPRHRHSDYDANLPVSSVEFELTAHEREKLAEICPSLQNSKYIIGTRNYSNRYDVKFLPSPDIRVDQIQKYLTTIQSWKREVENSIAPDGKGEQIQPIKESLSDTLTESIEQLNERPTTSQIVDIINTTHSQVTQQINEGWQQEVFKKIIKESETYIDMVKKHNELKDGEKWFQDTIPKFIYFDRYDMIQSAINIDNFIQKLNANPSDPQLRITKCLFKHVGLSIERIRDLDPTKEGLTEEVQRMVADERAIRLSSASDAMTRKFEEWWENRKYKFRYDIDGQLFRVWVSDNLNTSEIELDQRSAGMQYFFSFYLVFLVESDGAHSDSILLLDEPGLHYHGTAQKKTVEFLQKISEKNQVLYTTHSPFMIDGSRLQDVKIVYENKETGNAMVSADTWPDDGDSLFPLQAGLGYSIAQTLFYSKYQLVVEGLTDYLVFKAMNKLLSCKNMETLNEEIVIVPAGGTRNILPLTSILRGHHVNAIVFLDGDPPGINTQKTLKKKLLQNCILVTNYTDGEKTELEDLFPEALYIEAVQQSYSDKKIDLVNTGQNVQNITAWVKSMFKQKGYGKFEKWVPIKTLVDWIMEDPTTNKIPDVTCKKFEAIFRDVNKLLGTMNNRPNS